MIERDRWGRPLITPPDGGKPVPYTRCTTYVGCLEDTYNLSRWQQRNVAIGLSIRPDLVLKANAARDDKETLNDVCSAAAEAASASAAATTGTALHELTEQYDRGTLDLDTVPPAYRPDLDAYVAVTKDLTMDQIETFVVVDPLKVGGTFDRTVTYQGKRYVADLKTGADMQYGRGKIAMQLAVYAHGLVYDPETHDRTELTVDQERAIVIHLPAGKGKGFLHWVDIARGWEGVRLAGQVRGWRATEKSCFEPFAAAKAPEPIYTAHNDLLMARILMAQDVTALRALWAEENGKGTWTDQHTTAAKRRQETITEGDTSCSEPTKNPSGSLTTTSPATTTGQTSF